jgi:hypothetical protein
MPAPIAPMTAASAMMFIGTCAFLLLGVFSNMRAFTLVQTKLPGIFKHGYFASYLVEKYIWDEAIPAEARRKYFVYLGATVAGAGFMAGFAFLQDILVATLWCSGIAIYGAMYTLRRWFQYRHRL